MRPRDPSVAYGFGRVHLSAGRLEEARQAFEQLAELSPTYQQGHVLLATVYYRLGLKELGDQQRATVEKLRAQSREGAAADDAGAPAAAGPAGLPPSPPDR